MKSSSLIAISATISGVFFLTACSSQAPAKSFPQNPVSQTQQGIQVGLSIYPTSQATQQPAEPSHKNFTISILTPDLSKPIKSPLTIHGTVSGQYFFEGTFPVSLQDSSGSVIVNGQAHADNEWMTENVVPFTVQLAFKAAANSNATLIFSKDNPSGLPANDYSQSFAVTLQ